jgi:membrane associated rhomboid family serine protease
MMLNRSNLLYFCTFLVMIGELQGILHPTVLQDGTMIGHTAHFFGGLSGILISFIYLHIENKKQNGDKTKNLLH